MTTLNDLRARVTAAYERLDLPSWPDPHPERSPLDEEYSRVTDPQRYRIVHALAHLWTDALRELAGAEVSALAAGPIDEHLRFDRGVRITSPKPGTLPLLLLERDVWISEAGAFSAVLHICVGRVDIAVEMQPDCGCDACDSGSDDLLDALNQAIGQIVGGPFVALRAPGWSAHWHPDGGAAGGGRRAPDFEHTMRLCRRLAAGEHVRLPRGAEAFVGHSWLA